MRTLEEEESLGNSIPQAWGWGSWEPDPLLTDWESGASVPLLSASAGPALAPFLPPCSRSGFTWLWVKLEI